MTRRRVAIAAAGVIGVWIMVLGSIGTVAGTLRVTIGHSSGSAAQVHSNKRSFEDKESRRWLDAARQSEALKSALLEAVDFAIDRAH